MPSKRTKGQAVVELALVLPIFIFVILGIFDFGRALHAWSNLNFQCMQAARAATKRINPLLARNLFTRSTHPSEDEVKSAFWKNKSPMMVANDISGPVLSGVGDSSREVQISASYRLNLITPLLGNIVGGQSKDGALVISATARESKE